MAQVLSAADAACYVAKESGRNRMHEYQPDDTAVAERYGEMQWIHRIHKAFAEQPLLPLPAGHPSARRLRRRARRCARSSSACSTRTGRIATPGAFIPAAERYHLIASIDRWVVPRRLRRRSPAGASPTATRPASPSTSRASRWATRTSWTYVLDEIAASGVPGRRICFEITETAAVGNLAQAMRFIEVPQEALGCRFVLDDFGSGLSSFAYLKNLQVDFLKIDGAFVRDMVGSPVQRALVESIHQIGQVMGIRTIAESVENRRYPGRPARDRRRLRPGLRDRPCPSRSLKRRRATFFQGEGRIYLVGGRILLPTWPSREEGRRVLASSPPKPLKDTTMDLNVRSTSRRELGEIEARLGDLGRPGAAVAEVAEPLPAPAPVEPAAVRLFASRAPAIVWTTDRALTLCPGPGPAVTSQTLDPARLAGLSVEEVFGIRDPELPPLLAHRSALAGKASSFEQEWQGRLFQATSSRCYDDDGLIVGTIGIAVDVTERKQVEEALHREKERALVTLASIGDGVIRTDAEGRIDYMNPVAEKLTGWSVRAAPTAAGRRSLRGSSTRLTRQPLREPVGRCLEEGRSSSRRGTPCS